jgi:hypothetical protein
MIFRLKFLPLLSVALAAALFLPAQAEAKIRDRDHDGVPNYKDKDIDGDGIKNGKDSDVDGDGIKNGKDSDIDDDGIKNGNDPDVDADGLKNGIDPDIDGDGFKNAKDFDIDGDGILNGKDPDVDGDGLKNGIDPDIDGDGLLNGKDPDIDGDGILNGKDPDVDGDGLKNGKDSDMDGDGIKNDKDADSNGDGLIEPKAVKVKLNPNTITFNGSNTNTNSGSLTLTANPGSFVYPNSSGITSTSSTLGGSISGSGNFKNVFLQPGLASYLTTTLLPTPLGGGLTVKQVTYAPTFSSWFKIIDPSVSGVLTPPNAIGPSFAALLTSNTTITFHCVSPDVSLTTGIAELDYAITRNEQGLPVSLKISSPSTALLQNLHNTSYIIGFSIEGTPYEVPAWSIETDDDTGEISVIFDLAHPSSPESISGNPASEETPVPDEEEEISSDSTGGDLSSALDDFEELFDGELPVP